MPEPATASSGAGSTSVNDSAGPNFATDTQTIDGVLGRFADEGYSDQMAAREGGRIMCFACREESDAVEVTVTALRRLEGASDPDDMLAVAALVCPHCDAHGVVVLKFGPDAPPEDSDALLALDDARSGTGTKPTGD